MTTTDTAFICTAHGRFVAAGYTIREVSLAREAAWAEIVAGRHDEFGADDFLSRDFFIHHAPIREAAVKMVGNEAVIVDGRA